MFESLHKPMQDMHLPALNRDDLLPRRPAGMGKGLLMAIAAHVLLVVALTFSVNWNSSDPAGVEAELWSAVPQIAAQRVAAIEPEPTPPTPEPKPEPKPVPKPVETPPPKPAPDPQIAIEKEKEKVRKEKQLKEEKLREQQEQDKKKKAEAQKREAEDKKAEEKKLAEKKKQDAARQQAQLDAQRDAQLKRILAQAGADNGSPSGKGTVTSGPSSTYGGRIRAAVEPNITLTTELNGNPTAEVEVRQGPDGTITGSRLVKSSGVKEWDDAVLRAVDKTQKLPRDIDGRVISPIVISFRPNK